MFTLFTYTPVMDEVSLKLMHDVETNPGPCCSRGDCPGAGILGFLPGVLHNAIVCVDPLERLFDKSTYTFGGVQRYKDSIEKAIQAFIDREYPDVGGRGLKVVPDLPRPRDDITWEDVSKHWIAERHGGLLQSHPSVDLQNIDRANKHRLDELVKKHRGEEGERLAAFPLLEWLSDRDKDSTVILGQKSMLTLFHQQMKQELSNDPSLPEPVDKKIAVVEKVSESVGIILDIPAIEVEAKALMHKLVGGLGPQPVIVLRSKLQNLPSEPPWPPGGPRPNKHQRQKWKKNLELFRQILDDNSKQTDLDMLKYFKCELMLNKLNMGRKEHDTLFVIPGHKTIGQVEVKALETLGQSNEVTCALKQLEGGQEEMLRAHGHLLDSEWSYLGIICLPNLPSQFKQGLCTILKICNHCADYILAGNVKTGMKFLLERHFPLNSGLPDETVWRDQYKKITSRLLAMEHLRPSVSTVQRMAGTDRGVVAGFREGDEIPDLSSADAAKIKAWKTQKHLGSPTSILFFTQEQLRLWDEKKIIFLADYSTGKTTLLKSKAASLAGAGQALTFIFMGGCGKTEAVMNIANKIDFDNYPTITVLSQQDLEEKYREQHPWIPYVPSPLALIKFLIEKEKPKHLLVDEVPLEESSPMQLIGFPPRMTSKWKQLVMLPNLIVGLPAFSFSEEVAMGYWFLLSIIWFLCGGFLVYFSTTFLVHLGGAMWVAIIIGGLMLWSWVGAYTDPLDLDKTRSLLTSLPPLLSSSSSILWVALHSSPLTDHSVGLSLQGLRKEKLESWKSSLAPTFRIPTLKHNLRNSHEVASVRGLKDIFFSFSPESKALPTAPAPRPLPTLPASPVCKPLLIPLHSVSQLGEAIKSAYASLETPDALVVLLDDINQHEIVKSSLAQQTSPIVTYTKPTEGRDCENFLRHPVGALITSSQLFSGMEAANVIWVKDPRKVGLHRSSRLRAIHKLCLIDTNSNYNWRTATTGLEADGTFAKCHRPWFGRLYRCKTCNAQPILCQHCAYVCHQTCEKDQAEFRSILHAFLQYNPCSCKSSRICKLNKPTRRLLHCALETIIATVIACGLASIFIPGLIVIGLGRIPMWRRRQWCNFFGETIPDEGRPLLGQDSLNS